MVRNFLVNFSLVEIYAYFFSEGSSSEPIFTTAVASTRESFITPDSSLPPTTPTTVVNYNENLEQEFHSMNFLTTDAPVDVDEALQTSNQWVTTEETVVRCFDL